MTARAANLSVRPPLNKGGASVVRVGAAKGIVVRTMVLSRVRDGLVLRLVENAKVRTKAKPNERTAR